MRNNYKVRAEKFAHVLVKLFADCEYLEDFEDAVRKYNNTHNHCSMKIAHGVSRIAIIRSDYVIKFQRRKDFQGWAGDSTSERKIYEKAVRDGYDYLLAETTLVNIDGVEVAIMPRVRGIGSSDYENLTTWNEQEWIESNIYDLHSGNFGCRNGVICIVDYAWAY